MENVNENNQSVLFDETNSIGREMQIDGVEINGKDSFMTVKDGFRFEILIR